MTVADVVVMPAPVVVMQAPALSDQGRTQTLKIQIKHAMYFWTLKSQCGVLYLPEFAAFEGTQKAVVRLWR
jgi:hypothetical protein